MLPLVVIYITYQVNKMITPTSHNTDTEIPTSQYFEKLSNELDNAKTFLKDRWINTWWYLVNPDSYWKDKSYSELFHKSFAEKNKSITQQELDVTLDWLHKTKENLNKTYQKYAEDQSIDNSIKTALLERIEFDGNYLEMLINCTPLEAQKWWLEITDELQTQCEKKTEEMQDKLYWPKMQESEKKEVTWILTELYKTSWSKLTEKEQKYFKSFLEKQSVDTANVAPQQENKENTEAKESRNIKEIPVEKFKQIVELSLKITEKMNPAKEWKTKMTDYNVIISDKATMVSVKFDALQIILPRTRWYTEKDLWLIDHEIITHAYRGKNTRNNLWWFNTWAYVDGEEWNAMVAQYFGWTREEYEEEISTPTIHFISNYFWETSNFKDTSKLMYLYSKMKHSGDLSKKDKQKLKKNAHNRTVRVKRFYSNNQKWANMKDLAYYRWVKEVSKKFNIALSKDSHSDQKEEVLSWLKKNYNIGKIWLDDVDTFSKVITDNQQALPLFIGKLINLKRSWEKIFFSWLPSEQEDSELYKNKDFRFEFTEISTDVKRDIIEILYLLDEEKMNKRLKRISR